MLQEVQNLDLQVKGKYLICQHSGQWNVLNQRTQDLQLIILLTVSKYDISDSVSVKFANRI